MTQLKFHTHTYLHKKDISASKLIYDACGIKLWATVIINHKILTYCLYLLSYAKDYQHFRMHCLTANHTIAIENECDYHQIKLNNLRIKFISHTVSVSIKSFSPGFYMYSINGIPALGLHITSVPSYWTAKMGRLVLFFDAQEILLEQGPISLGSETLGSSATLRLEAYLKNRYTIRKETEKHSARDSKRTCEVTRTFQIQVDGANKMVLPRDAF